MDNFSNQVFTNSFRELDKHDVERAGGKGASLGEMTQAGISVPPGYVVLTDAFEQFLDATDLRQVIRVELAKVDQDAVHTAELASEHIQNLIKQEEVPEDIKAEILDAFAELGAKYVAVRSSATSEDGTENAWAGQLDSFLNTTEETLLENVKNCWASLFTPRAIFYRIEKGLKVSHVSVAVVVQKMVESESSGIAFSVHPVTEDPNQLIIEAGFGLGEAIVSGSITPDSYVVEKEPRTIIDSTVVEQRKGMFRKGDDGANEWRDITSEQGAKQVLSEEQIFELTEEILRIEQHYGFPCDIEWAFENGELYIVQSRPITTLSLKDVDSDVRSDYKEKERPPKKSDADTEIGWQKMATRTQDVLHWDANISVRREKIKVGPIFFGSRNDLILKNDETLPTFYAKNAPLTERTNFHEYCKVISVELDEALENVSAQINSDLSVLPGSTKLDAYELYKKFRTNMGHMLFGLSCSKIPLEFLKESLGSERFLSMKDELLRPHRRTMLGREAHAIFLAQKEIVKNSTEGVDKKAEELADQYGFIHSEYVSESWTAEDYKRALLDTALEIGGYREFNGDDLNEYEQWLVSVTQKLSYMHDEGKAALVRANWALRETMKLLGYDDSFLRLTEREFFKWIQEGNFPSQQELSERKNYYAILSEGNVYKFYFGRRQVEEFALAQGVQKASFSEVNLLEGNVASAGVVKGKVRVVFTQETSKLLQEGEVLVTGMTTPAYIDAMRKAAAFVTDEGGVISHAAIIAREFKKPCVIGTKIATQVLHDGDLVEVDADNGIVRKI